MKPDETIVVKVPSVDSDEKDAKVLLGCNTELKNGSMTDLNTHILKTSTGTLAYSEH